MKVFLTLTCFFLYFNIKFAVAVEKKINRAILESEVDTFLDESENTLGPLLIKSNLAQWTYAIDINNKNKKKAEKANIELQNQLTTILAKIQHIDKTKLNESQLRILKRLSLANNIPTPPAYLDRTILNTNLSKLSSSYQQGHYCPPSSVQNTSSKQGLKTKPTCLNLREINYQLANESNAEILAELWLAWHEITKNMKVSFSQVVETANKAAQYKQYRDLSHYWQSKYETPARQHKHDFTQLWQQVKPLYKDLHCYVATQLQTHYKPPTMPKDNSIPIHLLGDLWAQSWLPVLPLIRPEAPTNSLQTALLDANYTPKKMVKTAEQFFISLGFSPLPLSFWHRSVFTKPKDTNSNCQASAWSIDGKEDLRLKMCININQDDFYTVHHELGHHFYQRSYQQQRLFFRDGAHDGFHEAVGDAIALSITPSYLNEIGLSSKTQPQDAISPLLEKALTTIPLIAYAYIADIWRWQVFGGEIEKKDWNKHWWNLRKQEQGIIAPHTRTEKYIDALAKYHLANNIPYSKYFFAAILQFQIHQQLCLDIGHQGQLHKCSIYGNKKAGQRLKKLLEQGASLPWSEQLKQFNGQEKMDGKALVNYFLPLHTWLKRKNEGQECYLK